MEKASISKFTKWTCLEAFTVDTNHIVIDFIVEFNAGGTEF